MIPTAEEFLIRQGCQRMDCEGKEKCDFFEDVQPKDLIEFAKLHVEAALKEALESIPCLGSSSDIATYEEVEDAVLNSYPLENII
jgi:hypothetical protein